ncbi:MAG: hypothetical protein R3321_00040 [Nitrososphaeraceae archaeon]|nr:hypothetical protein [Nitrososphaeraceae archaeon]
MIILTKYYTIVEGPVPQSVIDKSTYVFQRLLEASNGDIGGCVVSKEPVKFNHGKTTMWELDIISDRYNLISKRGKPMSNSGVSLYTTLSRIGNDKEFIRKV